MEFFLLDTLKTTFWIEYLTPKWTQSGSFSEKSQHFFRFSKKGRGGLPPPSLPLVARLGEITDSLDLYEFTYEKVCEGLDDIYNIVYKFRNHPSIVKIKERYKVKGNFSFRLVTTEEINAGGEIPVNILKKNKFFFWWTDLDVWPTSECTS